MLIRHIATAVAAASLLAGCSIHPDIEEVTGLETSDIVKQIRCETRDAARTIILRQLEKLAGPGRNATAASLLAEYTANPDRMVYFKPNDAFPGVENKARRAFFEVIYKSAVGYSFELTMTEGNNLGSTLNLLGPWQSTFTLGITGNANRSRQNVRTFTITDRFSFLLGNMNPPPGQPGYCDRRIVGPNYVYPIAGTIGMYKTVHTFLELAIFGNLEPDKAGVDAKAPPMVDQLTFTTQFDLSATPQFVFTPLKTGFQATDIKATGLVSRRDQHQVTVALALDPGAHVALGILTGYVFSGVGTGPRVTLGRVSQPLVLRRVTANATSPAEQLVLAMIDQVKSRELQLIPPPP